MVSGLADERHDLAAATCTGQLAVPTVPAAGIDSAEVLLRGDPARHSPARTTAAPIDCRTSETRDELALDLTTQCFISRSISASACHPRCLSRAAREALARYAS